MIDHLNWLLSKQRSSDSELPLNVRASHSKTDPDHLMKEAHLRRMYPQPHPLGHYPELVNIGAGWDVD